MYGRVVLTAGEEEWDKMVYVAGDTLTFEAVTGMVASVVGEDRVEWEILSREVLRKETKMDPENAAKRYRAIWGENTGVSWPRDQSWNEMRGSR